jgi:nucleoside-triphosphatase THEP1
MPTAPTPAPTVPTEDAALPVAAILDDGRTDADALLAQAARAAREAGRRVRGLLMTYAGGRNDCAADMVLVDVDTLEEYLVSQPLGAAAGSCRADPQGFARASRVLRDAREQAPDLVVCNRFGGMEAGGEGFTAELLELMAEGVPLLTVVSPRHLDAWTRFTGGAQVLPAEPDAVRRWLGRVLASRSAPA